MDSHGEFPLFNKHNLMPRSTIQAAAKKMVRDESKGKIVLVSSTLGYMSFVGWASYSPAKHALRGAGMVCFIFLCLREGSGLADTLQSEFMLYDIDIHIFFPPTMFTPGYEEENKTKPPLVLDIESTDDGITPEAAAHALVHGNAYKNYYQICVESRIGIQRGYTHITADMITELFRASTRGVAPKHNPLLDIVYDLTASVRSFDSRFTKLLIHHIRSSLRFGECQLTSGSAPTAPNIKNIFVAPDSLPE